MTTFVLNYQKDTFFLPTPWRYVWAQQSYSSTHS